MTLISSYNILDFIFGEGDGGHNKREGSWEQNYTRQWVRPWTNLACWRYCKKFSTPLLSGSHGWGSRLRKSMQKRMVSMKGNWMSILKFQQNFKCTLLPVSLETWRDVTENTCFDPYEEQNSISKRAVKLAGFQPNIGRQQTSLNSRALDIEFTCPSTNWQPKSSTSMIQCECDLTICQPMPWLPMDHTTTMKNRYRRTRCGNSCFKTGYCFTVVWELTKFHGQAKNLFKSSRNTFAIKQAHLIRTGRASVVFAYS